MNLNFDIFEGRWRYRCVWCWCWFGRRCARQPPSTMFQEKQRKEVTSIYIRTTTNHSWWNMVTSTAMSPAVNATAIATSISDYWQRCLISGFVMLLIHVTVGALIGFLLVWLVVMWLFPITWHCSRWFIYYNLFITTILSILSMARLHFNYITLF